MLVPKNGKLELRVLKKHQVDVIPRDDNPEMAEAYIVSSFEKDLSFYQAYTPETSNNEPFSNSMRGDGINQRIADQDDYRRKMRFLVWTEDMNFVMDGNGKIIGEALLTSLLNIMQAFPCSIRSSSFKDLLKAFLKARLTCCLLALLLVQTRS
jgi:hypothetical protein